MKKEHVVQPVGLAVHRAFRAAASASYPGDDHYDEFSSCGYLAASATFQAHLAGVIGIWEKVFETLEGVLAIGQATPTAQMEPHRGELVMG